MESKDLIQIVLEKTDLNYESLSKILNISPSYLKELEKGTRPLSITMKELLKKQLSIYKKELQETQETDQSMASDDIMQFLNNEESALEKDHLVDEDSEN